MCESHFFMEQIEQINKPSIIVHKSRRVLEVFNGDVLVARLHAAIGRGQSGPKMAEGDCCTPEGVYYVCMKNDKSKYHLSMGLSYPNTEDAKRGLEAGLITQNEYDSIAEAISQGKRPPWNTAMGGEIMIHGGGSDRDWTAGCIALDNDGMDYIWQYIENGSTVEILP